MDKFEEAEKRHKRKLEERAKQEAAKPKVIITTYKVADLSKPFIPPKG